MDGDQTSLKFVDICVQFDLFESIWIGVEHGLLKLLNVFYALRMSWQVF